MPSANADRTPPKVHDTAKIVGNLENFTMGSNVTIGDFCFINVGNLLHIDDDSYIHAGARLIGGGLLRIGKKVSIGYNTVIATGTDQWRGAKQMVSSLPDDQRNVIRGVIGIEDYAWIGANAVITVSPRTKMVVIGKGSVVGALSYVDKDVPPYSVGWGRPWQKKHQRGILK